MLNLDETKKHWKLPDSRIKYTNDELVDYLKKSIKFCEENALEFEIAIGTDSQIRGNTFHFATVVSFYKKGKGGIYFYNLEIDPINNFPLGSQKTRMFNEVSKAIEIAQFIEDKLNLKPTIHIDASPPSKQKYTSSFSDQLYGYVVSCGFDCVRKPESWASSSIGDKHAKQRYKRKN